MGHPAVIHNNFIIGSAMKKIRFQRYGLWKVDIWGFFRDKSINTTSKRWVEEFTKKSTLRSDFYCSVASSSSFPFFNTTYSVANDDTPPVDDSVLQRWTSSGLFHSASRDTAITSLNIVLPLHDELDHGDEYMKTMVTVEGVGLLPGRVFMSRNPPSYFPFDSSFFVAELAYDFPFTSFTVDVPSAGMVAYANVVGGSNEEKSVSIDRSYKYHKEADERLRDGHNWTEEWDGQQKETSEEVDGKSAGGAGESRPQLKFQLRVLAYNRPKSLQRLLNSLFNAEYGNDRNVPLWIMVDHPESMASNDEVRQWEDTVAVAKRFNWRYGEKKVVLRSHHFGLKRQWREVFIPPKKKDDHSAVDENVIAIVLEDDLEVSPFFFRWASAATRAYYIPKQIDLHRKLLQAVREQSVMTAQDSLDCLVRSLSEKNVSNCGPLDDFVQSNAGRPLQYGLCLAKQREDFYHYPHELEIRNNNRPFMYSPIGTWGTVVYPVMWEAFLEWWQWRDSFRVINEEGNVVFPPYVDFDVLTNHFFTQNGKIWSPWHIRFAYDTGAKCVYPNLPGNLTLVSNHREKGSNYATTLGSLTSLLQLYHFNERSGPMSVNGDTNHVPFDELYAFPSYSSMVHYQYDLSLRRVGRNKYSEDSLFVVAEESPVSHPRLESEGVGACHSSVSFLPLSRRHWNMIEDMLEAYLAQNDTVLHVEPVYHDDYFHRLGVDGLHSRWKPVNNVILSGHCEAWRKHTQVTCIPLPDLDTGNIEDWLDFYNALRHHRVAMVVLNEATAVECLREKMVLIWDGLKHQGFPWLLVMGTCSEAPTGVSLLSETAPFCYSSDDCLPHSFSFSVVEKICSEKMWQDTGAVLYQRSRAKGGDRGKYVVTKRYHGQLMSSRVRESFSLLND